jgi:zinc transporter, ZIP family
MEIAVLVAAAAATALATGLGAIPVFFLGARAGVLRPLLWGGTVGTMVVASVVGLVRPALDEGGPAEVAIGLLAGAAFLLGSRLLLRLHDARTRVVRSASGRATVLVFAVLFVHSLPEGFAIGTAYASERAGLGLFVIIAIAIHNIPEGTSMAVPMSSAGYGRSRQFWAAVATSLPQVPGAVVAYLLVERVDGLLPASFAFAAGAMLLLVAVELAPVAFAGGGRRQAAAAAVAGGALMLLLAALLQPH